MATTVAEARAWAELGADAVSLQGAEAGGHRGTFLHNADDAMIGLFARCHWWGARSTFR